MNWNRLHFGDPETGPPDVPPGQTQGGGKQPAPQKPDKPEEKKEKPPKEE